MITPTQAIVRLLEEARAAHVEAEARYHRILDAHDPVEGPSLVNVLKAAGMAEAEQQLVVAALEDSLAAEARWTGRGAA